MELKFKVGDKVKQTKKSQLGENIPFECVGWVVQIDDMDERLPYRVNFDGDLRWVGGEEIELVSKATPDTFFFVAKDAQSTTVTYRHATIEEATAEAERLSKKENKTFFVLSAVRRIDPEVVVTVTDMG